MKYSAVLAAATLAVAVSAQAPAVAVSAQPPACVLTCATSQKAPSGCSGITDFACVCKDNSFIASLQKCICDSCSPADLSAAKEFAKSTCGKFNPSIGEQKCPGEGGSKPTSSPKPTSEPKPTGSHPPVQPTESEAPIYPTGSEEAPVYPPGVSTTECETVPTAPASGNDTGIVPPAYENGGSSLFASGALAIVGAVVALVL